MPGEPTITLITCGTCKEDKVKTDFYVNRDSRRTRTYIDKSRCKECTTKRRRLYKQKEYKRNRNLEVNYGITSKDYEELLKQQNYCCACCKESYLTRDSDREWPVDHNHATGEIRGILCSSCNSMLGYAKDDSERLLSGIIYLRGESDSG